MFLNTHDLSELCLNCVWIVLNTTEMCNFIGLNLHSILEAVNDKFEYRRIKYARILLRTYRRVDSSIF